MLLPERISPAQQHVMNDHAEQHRIRLVILDQFGLYRVSLGRLLAADSGIEVAGECATADEVLEILARSAVDLLLSDFDASTEQGYDFMTAARQAGYQGRFLIVTASLDARKAAFALKLGASGIFLKSEAPDRLQQVIRAVAAGDTWVDPKLIHSLADELVGRYRRLEGVRANSLDAREQEVLAGIVGGLSNRKIGENMRLSESSVKNVVQRLFNKTGVKTRSQLVRIALQGSLNVTDSLEPRLAAVIADAARPGEPDTADAGLIGTQSPG